MTHTAQISVEVVGPEDVYNELILTFNLKMTDPGSRQTWEQPAEGPEFEVITVNVDWAEAGMDGAIKNDTVIPTGILQGILGPTFIQACIDRACETAEETT